MFSIESFLAAFSRAASGSIPNELLESRRREIRNHLEASATEVGEIEAVRRFGSPRQLANELIRLHRGYTTATPGRLLTGVGCLIGLTILLHEYRFEAVESLGSNYLQLILISRWLPVVGLLAFGYRAAQTRRWLLGGAIPYLLAISLIAFLISPLFVQLHSSNDRVFANATQYLAEIKSQRSALARWQLGSPPLDRAPIVTFAQPILEAPMLPFRIELGPPFATYGLAKFDAKTSFENWQRYGQDWAASYAARLQEVEQNLSTLQAAREKRIVFPRITRQLVSTNALFLAIQLLLLAATNGLALLIGKAADYGIRGAPRTARRTG